MSIRAGAGGEQGVPDQSAAWWTTGKRAYATVRSSPELLACTTIASELSDRQLSAREWAILRLQEIEFALRDADDVDAIRVVQKAIDGLKSGPNRERTRLGRIGDSLKQTVSAFRSGAARVTPDTGAIKAAVDKADSFLRASVAGATGGVSVAHEVLADYASNLGNVVPTEFAAKFITAEARGIDRSLEEARAVWETLPEQLRALGPEEVSERLHGFDWSHIVPRIKGGSDEASNGIFELAGLNRSRGAAEMTGAELQAAQDVRCRDSGFTLIWTPDFVLARSTVQPNQPSSMRSSSSQETNSTLRPFRSRP